MTKKRGNGEGSITRRSDGLYMGRYTAHTPTGTRRKAVYGATRAEVSEKLTKAMADRDGGMVFEAGSITTGDYLRRWLTDCVAGTMRQSTYDSYRRIVDTHLIGGLGPTKLAKLTPPAIRALYRQMGSRGLSAPTIGYAHSLLKKALKQAVMDSLIPRNPAEAVAPPKLSRDEIAPMTAEEANAFLATASGDRWEALYVVAIRTGMRPGEMLALRWSDVDLEGPCRSTGRWPITARWGRPRRPRAAAG